MTFSTPLLVIWAVLQDDLTKKRLEQRRSPYDFRHGYGGGWVQARCRPRCQNGNSGIEILKELAIPAEQIRASGGGSRSFLWRQSQADVYGKEVVTLRTSEGLALGADLLAGVGARVYASVEDSTRDAIQ
jgi:hypothetical protein